MKTVISITLISFITLTISAQSKLTDRRVSVHLENISFEVLLGKLRSMNDINILYSIDRFKPSRKKITIKLSNVTVKELMTFICDFYDLQFSLSGNFFLLTPRTNKPIVVVKNTTAIDNLAISAATIVSPGGYDTTESIHVAAPEKLVKQDSAVVNSPGTMRDSVVKKVFRISIDGKPKKQKSNNVLGLALITDFHNYHFKTLADRSQNYSSPLTSGFSFLFVHAINRKLYSGTGLSYCKKEFTYNRNLKPMEMDDPVSIPNRTKVSTHYLEIPLEISYQCFQTKPVVGYITTGIAAAFCISKEERTDYLTYGKPDTNYFKDGLRENLIEVFLGMRGSLKVVKDLYLFIEPRYQKLFHKVNTTIMTAGADVWRFNTGLFIKL